MNDGHGEFAEWSESECILCSPTWAKKKLQEFRLQLDEFEKVVFK